MFIRFLLVLAIFVLVFINIQPQFFHRKLTNSEPNLSNNPEETKKTGNGTYTDTKRHFMFEYPQDLFGEINPEGVNNTSQMEIYRRV